MCLSIRVAKVFISTDFPVATLNISPTDFELVISDESHRSINGNARAVFEYFIGYKLGLTATPKDYLKGADNTESQNSQREFERRQLLDTYKTFGCESMIAYRDNPGFFWNGRPSWGSIQGHQDLW